MNTDTEQNKTIKGVSLSVISAFCASLFFIPYKAAITSVSPDVYVMAVFIIAFFLNSGVLVAKKKKIVWNKPTILGAIAFAMLSIAGNFGIGNALGILGSAMTVVVLRTQVFIVMFLGWLLLKEEMNKFLAAGVLVSFSGFFLMNNPLGSANMHWTAIGWAMVGAGSFALSQIMLKKIIHQIDPITLNNLRLGIAGLMLALLPGRLTSLAQMDLRLWGLAFISAFFGPTISRVLQMYALRYIPVSQSILFGMLTPIFTLFLAWGLFSHLPSVIQMVGGILILIGISIPVLWVLKKTANQTI